MNLLLLVILIVFELLCQLSISHSAESAEPLQCPVDGAWTLWTVWSACEGECGNTGHQQRTRNCSLLHSTDQRETRPCAVPGCSFEQYEKLLSENSVRLQQLKMLKQLSSSKTALLAKCVSSNCEFNTVVDELEKSAIKFWNALQCVKKDIGCPVAGGWSEWSAWSRCSARCGEGSQFRCRVCCNPPPSSVQRNCPGDNFQHSQCTASECGDTRRYETFWSSWSEWSPCSASCGFGIKRRSRTCSKDSQTSLKTSHIVDETPSESSLNDFDSYDDYSLENYGLDEKFEQYRANLPEEDSMSRQEVRNKRSCKANIEYYSTAENYDDYTDQIDATFKSKSDLNGSSNKKPNKYSNVEDDVDSLYDTTKFSGKFYDKEGKLCSPKVEYFSTEINEDEDYTTKVYKPSKISMQPEIKTKQKTVSRSDFKPEHSSTESLEEDLSKTVEPDKITQLKVQGSSKTQVEEYFSEIETTMPYKSTEIISSSKRKIHRTTLYTTQSISIHLKSSTTESTKHRESKNKSSKCSSNLKSSTALSVNKYTELDQNKAKGSGESINANKCVSYDKTTIHSTLPCKSKLNSKWNAENILPDQEGFHIAIDDDPGTTTNRQCKDQLFYYQRNYLNPKLSTNLVEESVDEEAAQGQKEDKLTESKLDSRKTSECVECVTIKPEQIPNFIESLSSQAIESEKLDEKTAKMKTILKLEDTKNTKSDLVCNRHSTSTLKLSTQENALMSSSSMLTSFTESSLADSRIKSMTSTLELNKEHPVTTSYFNQTVNNISSIQSFKPSVNADMLTKYSVVSPSIAEYDDQNSTELMSSSINCDLVKLLHLPNFNDSFKSEGCRGPFEEIKSCNDNPCKVSGGWSSWSAWSPCIPECGIGKQSSTRSCTNPEPGDKGSSCSGETSRKRSCFLKPCSMKVTSSRALLMTGDSVIKYEPLQQHSSMLVIYVRFRHYNCSGELITRRSTECKTCDVVSISLVNCCVLVFIMQKSCYTHFSTVQSLLVGDWHGVLMTIEGSIVSLRLDDSHQVQKVRLSCRPKSPNYDSAMKIGGRFIGEVDHLSVNFKRYALQKKHAKRDVQLESSLEVEPAESSQVQVKLNSEELPSVSLAQFLQAPCFHNSSAWQLRLAVKPEFSIGLVMFLRGYDESEFLALTLEGEEVRLRVKMGARLGECEQAVSVVPRTWLHITLSKPASAPFGLAVNGNVRCVAELDVNSDNDGKEVLQCSEILLGEVPLFVKMLMDNPATRSAPVKSPLGELGLLAMDNRTLDLSRLPRKVPPDLIDLYPQKLYRLSSYSATSTVYFEEVLVLMKEPLSLLCVYDISVEEPHLKKTSKRLNTEIEYSVSWLKLDISVETYFNHTSSTKYQISDDGKSSTLNITEYTDVESVEGFYSCWLPYPLPQQPGLNIITYQVVVVTTDQDRPPWLILKNNAVLVFLIIILNICVIWILCEAIIDQKKGSGFIRCKRLDDEEEHKKVQFLIFSDKGIKRLGRTSAAQRAHDKYLTHIKTKADNDDEANPLLTSVENSDVSGMESNVDYEATDHEVKIQMPDNKNSKKQSKAGTTVVGYSFQNPPLKFQTHAGIDNRRVGSLSVEDLQDSDPEELPSKRTTNGKRLSAGVRMDQAVYQDSGPGDRSIYLKNYKTSLETPSLEKIGNIQDTLAYRNIENDLKFRPDKYKVLEKYWSNNKKPSK